MPKKLKIKDLPSVDRPREKLKIAFILNYVSGFDHCPIKTEGLF